MLAHLIIDLNVSDHVLKNKQEKIEKLIMDIENKNSLINELRNRIECLIKENKKINGSFKKI